MNPPAAVSLTGEIDKIGFGVDVTFTPGVVSGINTTEQAVAVEMRPKPITRLKGFGYLQSANVGDKDLMDYVYERDVPYNLKDNLLPIPFSNADIFHVSGGGSFRAFNRNAGTFHQNVVKSKLDISIDVPSIIVGAGFGGGYRWGDGSVEYKGGVWDDPEAASWRSFSTVGDEPWFFRFSGDMGGSLLYDNDDRAVSAAIIKPSGGIGAVLEWLGINDLDRYPVPPSDLRLHLEDWERPGRNSYVGFTRNGEMLDTVNGTFYKSWNRDSLSRSYVSNREDISKQIGEFSLSGQGGSRYIYGLPLFSFEEEKMELGLRNYKLDSAANIHHNLRAYRWTDHESNQIAIGQRAATQYASAWLITEITTSDYVDLTGDGGTDDDLGGWTKFRYRKYNPAYIDFWRQPFNGLAYDPVEISDPEDDLGSYSRGFRERYYLDRIETKTHIALFVLNDSLNSSRNDGFLPPSPFFPFPWSDAQYAGDQTLGAPYPLSFLNPRYLSRIELYTKDADGNPDSLLRIVHFEYDYSLRENMPNSVISSGSDRYGMLTLRKVWTELHNVKNATIYPILFGYDYKKSEDYSVEMQTRYPEITAFADSLTDAMQNPDYSLYDFDAWGNYRPGGADRLDKYAPYIPQNDTSHWDPAAWQLKWIRSASGGELHIQYEEDDYAFVHDQPSLAMVSLIAEPGAGFGEQSSDGDYNNKYFLRLSDIGVDSTDFAQVVKVRELIHKEAERHQRLLFRFLYALKGTNPSITNPEYNSEFITGHANLDGTGIDTINSGPNEWYALYVQLIGKDEDSEKHEFGLPKKICLDYVRKRKRGKLGPKEGIKYDSDLKLYSQLSAKYIGFNEEKYCKEVDYANSYIRIPMLSAKKGGGLRVKRLLSYDPGIEGDSALYGTEYRYETYDPERNEVLSSGVATNEPALIRDENPLVSYRERNADEEFKEGKIVAGRDRPRNEDPIGETLLPSPYVTYARTVTHPIHQGATTSGFSVLDFFTYRDYPWDNWYKGIGRSVDYTELVLDEYRTSPKFTDLLIYRQDEHLAFATQGVRFIRTNMPGRLRRQLVAGGIYTPLERDWIVTASTENLYFQPGDSIPLLYHLGDTIRYGNPGKVMEIVHATRRNGSYIDEISVEADAGFIFFSGAAYYVVNNSQLSTHSTTKIVDYPAILKGVLSFADGNYNYTENVAFDPRSGSPSVTRSYDAFHGLNLDQASSGQVGTYHRYSIPLANRYPELGQIAANEGAYLFDIDGLTITKGEDAGVPYLDFSGGNEIRWLPKLTPGDLIELEIAPSSGLGGGGLTDAGRYHVDYIEGNRVWLFPSDLYNLSGSPALDTLNEVYVRVIRSGRNNSPGLALGGVMTYGETEAEVAAGTNVSWTSGDASGRLALVSTLNTLYGSGSGTIDSSNVDATLELRHYQTGGCATVSGHGETWSLTTSGDTIFIAMATMGSYTDTIVDQGLNGWFDLDDAGQIVFRSVGNLSQLNRARVNPIEQRVWNFTFCGDDPAHRSVANVIVGSASLISDTVDYDGGGVAYSSGPNPYEKGERGRWSPRTSFVYRTDVTGSSRPVAGERIYKAAGVFDDFSLFNWTEPESSDQDHWIQLGTVGSINKQNLPYSSVDQLGRSTIVSFDYGPNRDLLPMFSAWNAEIGTAGFESFEAFDNADLSGTVTDEHAHAGTKSISLAASGQTTYGMSVLLNSHVMAKGMVVRFWSTHDGTSLRVKYASGASVAVTPDRIARTGEWTLYEAYIHGDSIDVYYTEGVTINLRIQNLGGSTVWIDDVKYQPSDAIAGASVFDPLTFRPVAQFDDQNFGSFPIYDGRSSGYASQIETSRGLYTLGDLHGHIPGTTRDWLGEGSPFLSSAMVENPMREWSEGASTEPERVRADLFDLHFDISGAEVKTLGVDPSEIRSLLLKKYGELSQGQQRLIEELEVLKEQKEELNLEGVKAKSDQEREEIASKLQLLNERERKLVEQTGILSDAATQDSK
ncbi:MAG: hypothetical protein R3F28_13070 [Candidatus Kapaibacterium sp.]